MSTPVRPIIARLAHAAVITLLATPVLFVQSTLATPPVTERVSVDSAGNEANFLSESPSISSSGQFIAFSSEATNLVVGDSNGVRDIFLHDWLTGTTTRLSVDAQGQEANAASNWPAISANGKWVVFSSTASNLVENDNNGAEDIFVVEIGTGAIERVSLSASREQANASSTEPVISGDGRFVAFLSTATNLYSGANSGQAEIYLFDRTNRTIQWVSMPGGGANNWPGGDVSISADGDWIAFASRSSQLVPGDVNGRSDVFLWSRATSMLEIASSLSPTVQGNGSSYQPALSADGRFLAFRSTATNFVPSDSNGEFDVFRRDNLTGSFELVSLSSTGEQAIGFSSEEPVISADGRFVAFRSYASNLVPDDNNNSMDIFVRDMQGMTTRMSVDSNGSQANDHAFSPSISHDGSAVVFYSVATNLDLVRADNNGVSDVFSHGDKPLPEPTSTPTTEPSATPTKDPTPTETTTPEPTLTPTDQPTTTMTPSPSATSTVEPTATSTSEPTATPTTAPTTVTPTDEPTPTETSTPEPTFTPTDEPGPTSTPTDEPGPTEPPNPSSAPALELQTKLNVNEGSTFTASGSFSDPDSTHWTATVDYGDGQGPQSLALTSSKTFKLRWVYGDNGDFTAVVRVVDDSGAFGEAELQVHVKNASPKMESDNLHSLRVCDQKIKEGGKDKGNSACEIGDWFVATVGEPTVFSFNLADSGSDDLKIRWKFSDDVTYYNNGKAADPYPSPMGNYPFHITHNATVVFEKPGVQYVTIDLYDDDGAKTSMTVKVLVRGAKACRTSLGYWIKRFKEERYGMYSGELRAHLSILSAFITSSFGEYQPEMLDRLESFILNNTDDSAHARAEMLTAWLNFTNGAVDWDEVIKDADGKHDLPYAEVLREILAILVDRGVSSDELQHAIELAKSINLHNRKGRVCPVYDD